MKTALVTGSARGLGKEIARALARDGHSLYLVDLMDAELAATAGELREEGYTVSTRVVDVSDAKQCRAAVEHCVEINGNLSVLVNCAGIVRFGHSATMPEDFWSASLGVNLSGPFFMMQSAIPHLIAAKGNIVNVSSATGLFGAPYAAPYAATKAALISLTKTFAMEFMEEPIRINAILPGGMDTPLVSGLKRQEGLIAEKLARYGGMRGLSDPAEIAGIVAFMASDAAASVHGAIWTADNGLTAG